MFWNGYWKQRAYATEQALVDARREHMRDMTALVDAAGGVIRLTPSTVVKLRHLTLTISPIAPDQVEYRSHYEGPR
jgi:hypothetical protein